MPLETIKIMLSKVYRKLTAVILQSKVCLEGLQHSTGELFSIVGLNSTQNNSSYQHSDTMSAMLLQPLQVEEH